MGTPMNDDATQAAPDADSELAGLNPDLLEAFDDLMAWSSGPVPPGAYACCVAEWPVARLYFLREWARNLANPDRDEAATAMPVSGLYLAASNADASFLEILLRSLELDYREEELLFGDLFTEHGPALAALMARTQSSGIAQLEAACLPDPRMDAMRSAMPLEALALLVEHGVYPRDRFDALILRMDDMTEDNEKYPDRPERRQWMASVLYDCGPGELLERVKSWYEGELNEGVDLIVGLDSLLESAQAQQEERRRHWIAWKAWESMLKDPPATMSEHMNLWLLTGDAPEEDGANIPWEQTQATGAKIGRNEPCPCGSGKKYKKCCGKN